MKNPERTGEAQSCAGLCQTPPPKDAVNGPFYLSSVNHDSESPRLHQKEEEEEEKQIDSFIALQFVLTIDRKPFKANGNWDEIAERFRRK